MILTVDPTSEVPIYQQIRDRVVEAIATGELRDGDSLPSTRQLAVDVGVNFHTVNKAYDQLRQEGLLRLTRGSGGVVTRTPVPGFADAWAARLRTLLAEAVAHGVSTEATVEACRSVVASFAPISSASGRPSEPGGSK